MEVKRVGSTITLDLNTEEDAVGLFAVLTSRTNAVSPQTLEKGHWLYGWLYGAVQKLAQNYGAESKLVTQSEETSSPPSKSASNPQTKRGRKK